MTDKQISRHKWKEICDLLFQILETKFSKKHEINHCLRKSPIGNRENEDRRWRIKYSGHRTGM